MEIDGLHNLTDAVVATFRQLRDALQIREAIITFLDSPPRFLSAAEYREIMKGIGGSPDLPDAQ